MTSRTLGRAIVFCFVALTADLSKADVSITKHVKQGGNASGEWINTIRIKGLKMRIDATKNGENYISIWDLEGGKVYRLRPKRKEISVVDLKAGSEHLKGGFSPDRLRRVIKATGEKTEVGGLNCEEYSFDLQAPTAPSHGMAFVQHDSGTVCVSQTIPEGIEVTHFILEAKKRGFTMAADALSPSPSPIGSYFFGDQPNVVILAGKTESRLETPVMEMNAMSEVTNSFTVTSIKSEPIPDEIFQIPPDWKQVKESSLR